LKAVKAKLDIYAFNSKKLHDKIKIAFDVRGHDCDMPHLPQISQTDGAPETSE